MSDINLPHAGQPANGNDFDADPVRENLEYLAQILGALPGDNLVDESVLEAALEDAINPRLRASESFANYIASGGLPGGFSTFDITVPVGTAYTSGYRHSIVSESFTVSASKDTYFSVNKNSSIDSPQAVANGAGVPTLPTDSQWLFKVISNGSTITSIVDLRNRSPLNGTAIKQTLANAGDAGGTMYYTNDGGIKRLWGTTSQINVSGSGFQASAAKVITFPAGFFATIEKILVSTGVAVNSNYIFACNVANSISSLQVQVVQNNGANGGAVIHYEVVGT